ncbi:Grx4 family monothiol glutaredoxin [Anaplasmataceae bacterium AB001_6]|nr:Grx4 family monothiol glutaredoxin [Anaplasmataceae bacterium AB001_6]
MDETLKEKITNIVNSAPIVLFMKGNELYPACGYSGVVVKILNDLNCQFKTFDVLEDIEIRQGIKTFSDWQTIPQLYVKGEFIGGADIVRDLYQTGELKDLLANVNS